jgi:hypothetical protein
MYHNTYICEDFACLPQIVRIRGICPALEFFTVDFLSTDQQRLLHIKVFPGERRVVINSFLNDSWGEEAPSSDLDLAIGAPIDLVLLLTNSGVRSSFNDRVLEFYAWRAPISKTSAIAIEGIDAALFRSGLWSESAREIEIAPSNPLDPEVAQSLIGEGEPPPAIVDRGVLVATIEELEEHMQNVGEKIINIRRLLGLDYAR